MSDQNYNYEHQKDIINLIINESRHRQIVPFVGSGISFSTGFPTILPIIQYLAKVDFAIRFGIYKDRFPLLTDTTIDLDTLVKHYHKHPARYIRDFGWPSFGGLDADLWEWLEKEKIHDYPSLKKQSKYQELIQDFKDLEERDYLLALLQWDLRREQEQRDEGTAYGIKKEWNRWKKLRIGSKIENDLDDPEPKLLYGDWEMLLDKLCEGDFGLVDRLFGEFEKGLFPAQSHRLLALLQSKLGIPLLLTTNFDSFLERAFEEEGLAPKVFDIHRNAELPDPILIEKQLSILKLHGSVYGLRFGERLRQKLEMEAKSYIKQYLPKNALILVIGFSGSERRMMELLQAFIETSKNSDQFPRLIWIQGPGSPGPLYTELIAGDKDEQSENRKIRACQVKHADAFLQELYFNIAKSHQASTGIYLSQPSQYLTKIELKLPRIKDITPLKKIRPLQVFVSETRTETLRSGSWATLAGSAFAQSQRQHRVIWIDMENHGTVESIIAEFFSQVNKVDPNAPNFNFSLTEDEECNKEIIKKAVDRICDVFHRGKYALVLDSLESFGRPPMVHHGLPNFENGSKEGKNLLSKFNEQVDNIKIFLELLIEKAESYKDSYVIMTKDSPRERHPSGDETTPNQALAYLQKKILAESTPNEELGDSQKEIESVFYQNIILKEKKSKVIYLIKQENCKDKSYPGLYQYQTSRKNDFYQLPEDPIKDIDPNWKISKDLENRSIERAKHVHGLIKLLRFKKLENIDDCQLNLEGIISSFVCLLAFFRRPRSIPLRHAIIERWLLRSILGSQLPENAIDDAHRVIEHLLDLLTLTKSTVVEKKGTKVVFKNNCNTSIIGEPLLKITMSKNAIGIVAQRHEGGTIWMFREAHEETYGAITELLHVQGWLNTWNKDESKFNYDKISPIHAVLDGFLVISWHLHIARAYYVDVFLPTQDIKAFYEYLYHRVSALRTITLLIAILNNSKDKGILDEDTTEAIKVLKKSSPIQVEKGAEEFKNSILWYADVIGVFSENPDYDVAVAISAAEEPHNLLEYLTSQLKSLRLNALETLWKALQRNESIYKSQSVPEIMFSWSNQFLNRELPEIDGSIYKAVRGISNAHYLSPEEGEIISKITDYFEELEHMSYLSKLDFKSYICKVNDKHNFEYNELIKEDSIKTLYDNKAFKETKKILRSMVYLSPSHANLFAGNLMNFICSDTNEIEDRDIQIRSIYALKSKSILANWCIWKPLRDRHLPTSDKDEKMLSDAEQAAISYEDSLRVTCENGEEDAKHRSEAFGLRARALYLSNHFRQAHRFLDLGSSGLQLNRFEHRSNAGVIHILRAELLATSADTHFSEKLDQKIDKNELFNEVQASLKKIERAEQELNLAFEMFRTISHQRVWSVYLKFGQAQLCVERMLYEIESLFLACPYLKGLSHENVNTDYLKKSGEFEQNILICMEKIRGVLDLLPFIPDKWETTKDSMQKYQTDQSKNYPMLIVIERMSYGLWRDLFIVGAYYNSLLSILSENSKLSRNDNGTNAKIEDILGNIFSPKNKTHYLKRWERWSHSMRLSLIGKCVKFSASLALEELPKNKDSQYLDISLREKIIMDMKDIIIKEDEINIIWDKRRPMSIN